MKKVSVIGAGSWGSALAVLLANNGHEVTLWTHDPHEIEMLSTKREQVEKLPGVKLPDNIMIEADLKTALTDEDVVVMAVPSPVVRMVAKQMSPFIKDGQIIVNVAKGIEDVTYKTLSDIIEEEIPLFVMSNGDYMNGASVILYKDVLRDFAKYMEHDLYILPSSIHEVIILLDNEYAKAPEELARMVRETNRIVVDREEILSDHVYYYDREKDEIRIAK